MKIETLEIERLKLLKDADDLSKKIDMMKLQLLSSEHKLLKKLGYGLSDYSNESKCYVYYSDRYPFEKCIVLFANNTIRATLHYNNYGFTTKTQLRKLAKMLEELKRDERKLKYAIRKI